MNSHPSREHTRDLQPKQPDTIGDKPETCDTSNYIVDRAKNTSGDKPETYDPSNQTQLETSRRPRTQATKHRPETYAKQLDTAGDTLGDKPPTTQACRHSQLACGLPLHRAAHAAQSAPPVNLSVEANPPRLSGEPCQRRRCWSRRRLLVNGHAVVQTCFRLDMMANCCGNMQSL